MYDICMIRASIWNKCSWHYYQCVSFRWMFCSCTSLFKGHTVFIFFCKCQINVFKTYLINIWINIQTVCGQFQNLILINKKNKQGISDSGAMNILILEDFFSHSVWSFQMKVCFWKSVHCLYLINETVSFKQNTLLFDHESHKKVTVFFSF